MAKTNVPRCRTRQSRRLNPDAVEEEKTATSDQAKDEPKDTKPVVEDKLQPEEEKNESEPFGQQETGDIADQAESAAPDAKIEENKPKTQDAKGENDSTDLKLETERIQDKSDSTDDKTVDDRLVPANIEEDQAEVTSSDVQADTEVPQEEDEMKVGADAEVDPVIEVKGNAPTVSVSWETTAEAEDLTKTDCTEIKGKAEVTSSDVQAVTEVPLEEDAEVDAVIEVKGNAPTVSVSLETTEQQDQEMAGAEDLTKTDCTEISDVSEEEKSSPPEAVVVEESEEAHAKVNEDDEIKETKSTNTEETEDREETEMETASCEETECVSQESEQKEANDGGKSERNKETVKRKRKAKSSVDSSPSKNTKLINDGYCVYFGNLNNSKFYEDIKNTLAKYLMTQSLLVQDIRLDKAKKHAFVDLASEMDLKKALTLNGEKLLDKPMKVSKAKVKEADKVKIKDPQQVKQAKNERTLFVENIPFSAAREDVLKVFPKATALRFLGGTNSPSKGIAFVEFQKKEHANAALKLNGKVKIQERVLRVDVVRDKPGAGKAKSNSKNNAKSDTLFVSNLPARVQEKHLNNFFKNAVQINIPQSDGKSRGYAFVQFASVAHAQTALESAKNSNILNRPLKVQFGLKSKAEEAKVSVPSKTLIVLGLHQRTTANTLKEAFEGALSSRVFVDKHNELSRKFGFVDFESAESCRMAKELMEDVEIDGCKVTVAFARPKRSEGGDSEEKGDHKGGKGRGAGRPLPKRNKKVAN